MTNRNEAGNHGDAINWLPEFKRKISIFDRGGKIESCTFSDPVQSRIKCRANCLIRPSANPSGPDCTANPLDFIEFHCIFHSLTYLLVILLSQLATGNRGLPLTHNDRVTFHCGTCQFLTLRTFGLLSAATRTRE